MTYFIKSPNVSRYSADWANNKLQMTTLHIIDATCQHKCDPVQ